MSASVKERETAAGKAPAAPAQTNAPARGGALQRQLRQLPYDEGAARLDPVQMEGKGGASKGPTSSPSSESTSKGGDSTSKGGGSGDRDQGGSETPAPDQGKGSGGAPKSASGEPEIANTDEAMGDQVIADMQGLNSGGNLDKGVHYPHNYRELCRKKGQPERWKPEYKSGYADPSYWTQAGHMAWVLKSGKSASEGLRAWLSGLTIAECAATVFTAKTDAVRAVVGDNRFDELFGSVGGKPEVEQLRLGQHDNASVRKYTKNIGAEETDPDSKVGTIGHRVAQKGGLYYFYNHPKYLLKHPGGAWQGENALYLGEIDGQQKWSGFGAANVTEDQMLDEMVGAYNLPRNEDDLAKLEVIKERENGVLPAHYDPKKFPDQIGKAEILSEPAYKIDETTRKGGFVKESGEALDTKEVAKLKK